MRFPPLKRESRSDMLHALEARKHWGFRSQTTVATTNIVKGQMHKKIPRLLELPKVAEQQPRLGRIAFFFDELPIRIWGRGLQLVFDGACSMLAVYAAFQLRFEFVLPPRYMGLMLAWMLALGVIRPIVIFAFSGYTSIWRYFNLRDAVGLAIQALPVSAMLLVGRLLFHKYSHWAAVPVSVIVMELGLFVGLAFALRSLRRAIHEQALQVAPHRLRTVVVGNDHSLPAALRQVLSYPQFLVVGLLAEETKLQGLRICGLEVIGKPDLLAEIITRNNIAAVVIASAAMEGIGQIVATATEYGAEVRLLPSAHDLVSGSVKFTATPDTAKLLGHDRDSTAPHERVVEVFTGRAVLVTGAGGSIGSEISRQVSELNVSKVILLDQDENSIFELGNRLAISDVEICPVVGDIRDALMLDRLFRRYRPDVVLHAAAYKHVPVMEANRSEAVLNNVRGTRELVDVAVRYGCERFIMISTDKAVQPSSVMGATKRTAEMIVQERALRAPNTSFGCVRFGNVMGSRGSVVPIFLKQIAAGGPVTITHEEMTRYFMTIPQAVELVLQAATLASRGDIYMLDMGDPLKIVDVARKLIQMSGLRPEIDIPIKVTGTRPGEKLHEQLWNEGSKVSDTKFPGVFAVEAEAVPPDFLDKLAVMEDRAAMRDDDGTGECLRNMPIGFAEKELRVSATSLVN
jgi:FlaA1/EpsC-like NDP-sugar epimerase